MRILLDTCIAKSATKILKDSGYDVVHAGYWPADPGDEEILAFAWRENRILVTLDKNFGWLVVKLRQPSRGIIRLVEILSASQGSMILTVLQDFPKELEAGGLITASSRRVRVRLAEKSK